MNLINEKRTLTTVRLTDNQKKVMTTIVVSDNPTIAASNISDGRGMITARDILAKLELIDFRDGSASITDIGNQLLKDYNLIDVFGQLTDEGNKFGYKEEEQPVTTESLLKQVNEGAKLMEMDDIYSQNEWWKNTPEKLLAFVYWQRKQIPPANKASAYKDIVNQLNKKHPAPTDDLQKHLSAFK